MITPVEACGVAAQALFFGRMLVQGVASERARRPVAPPVFWLISLVATLLSAFYAWKGPSHDVVFAAASATNAALYVRLFALSRGAAPRAGGVVAGLAALAAAVAVVSLLLEHDAHVAGAFEERSPFWLSLGVLGQAAWTGRFVVQWLAAERGDRREVSPLFLAVGFAGACLCLAYAFHLGDRVWMYGLLPSPFVYARQILLHARSTRAPAAEAASSDVDPSRGVRA
jgi:lipid-A-disaccharide synthase-like uncharacterized protein